MRNQSEIFSYNLMIKEQHLDTYGHVNNATYVALYEEARWELITSRGFGWNKIMKEGKGPIILDISMRFSRELTNREKIRIDTQSSGYNGKVGKIHQTIFKEGEKKSSSAEFTWAFFDLEKRKIIPLQTNGYRQLA